MDRQRSSDRILYPHHDFGRDGYEYYQQHKQHDGAMSMSMSMMAMPSLSTGQGFYTVESLQGVSAVPPPPPHRFIPHPVEEGADDDEERSRHMWRNGWYYHANQLSIPSTGTTAMVDGRRQSAFGMHPPPPPSLLSHPRTSSSFVPDPRIVALHTQQRENLHRQNIHHRENIRRENIVERPPRGWAPSLPPPPPPPPPPPWTFEHRRTDMRHDRSHSRQRPKPKTQYPKVAISRGKAFGSDSSANVAKVVAVRQRGRHTDESLDKHVTRKRHKKQPDNEKHVEKPNTGKDVEEPDNENNVEKASKDEAEKLRQEYMEHREGKGMNRYEAKITDEEVVIQGDDVKNMYTSEGNNINKVVKMMVLDEVKSEVAQMVVEGDVIMEGKETILAGNDITAVCASSKTKEMIADVTDVAFICASTESKEIVVDKATVGVTNATIAATSAETKEVVIKESDG